MTGGLKLAWRELCERCFEPDVPLSRFTTIKTGGPARYFLEANDETVLAAAWREARKMGVPVLVIGNGSNLLISDKGFDGLAIHMGQGFSRLERDGLSIRAQAGAALKALAFFAADNDLENLSFAAGIPGTIGGAAVMNAGAFNWEMSQVIDVIDCVDKGGSRIQLSALEAGYSYRHSRMMEDGLLVLGVTLGLVPGIREAQYDVMASYQAVRRERQPLAWPSAGSFFKRPQGNFAGALIEQAGLKGFSVGQAQVSEKHAGFLINLGGATTADFLKLKSEVQKTVFERFGVTLEPEVRIIGEEAR